MNPTHLLTISLTLAALTGFTHAQSEPVGPDGFGGPPPPDERPWAAYRLSSEESVAAWEIQAGHFAQGLGLPAEVQRLVVDAYVKARQQFQEGLKELRPEPGQRRPRDGRGGGVGVGRGAAGGPDAARGRGGGDWPGRGRGGAGSANGDRPRAARQQEMADLLVAEKQQLRSDLEQVLVGGQLGYAMNLLGTFSVEWDVLVHSVAGLGLEPTKEAKALQLIEAYTAEVGGPVWADGGDRRAAMRERFEARQAMVDDMKAVLTEEEFAAFEEAMPGRAGARRGPGGWRAELDRNGDGLIQREEAPPRLQRVFDRLDGNGDGVLDAQEIEAAGERRRGDQDDGGWNRRRGGEY